VTGIGGEIERGLVHRKGGSDEGDVDHLHDSKYMYSAPGVRGEGVLCVPIRIVVSEMNDLLSTWEMDGIRDVRSVV
jgi:hypothetical protein